MNTLLVAVDFSDAMSAQLDGIRALFPPGSVRLRLVHVLNPTPGYFGYGAFGGEWEVLTLDAQRDSLEALLGEPSTMLLQEARGSGASVVVLGSHGHGAVSHLIMGSVATSVLRRAGRPVLIIPAVRTD
jgi:nucleotide-binding universal stress UspA family protein